MRPVLGPDEAGGEETLGLSDPGLAGMIRAATPLGLLDLRFLELDVLARDGVVLAEAHLLGLVARILLGHVEEAGVGAC